MAKEKYGEDATVDKDGNIVYKDENGDEQTVEMTNDQWAA
jgi:hypothetical protein